MRVDLAVQRPQLRDMGALLQLGRAALLVLDVEAVA